MSTTAQIRSAWDTKIWEHATTTALTTNIHSFDIASNIKGTVERQAIRFAQQINFFQVLYALREAQLSELRAAATAGRFKHGVQVFYYLQKDATQTHYNENTLVDRLETIDSLVASSLGKSWNSTVSYYELTRVIAPELIELDAVDVWRGGYEYTAFSLA